MGRQSIQEKFDLVLSDGSRFSGFSIGAEKSIAGEVVFNTGMVGYPEAFTDPSYRGQILCMTYPLMGNYGVPKIIEEHGILKNFESDRIHISGLIISDYSTNHNHWNSETSLSDWLKKEGIPALAGIDTRALTKKLREKGVMLGKIEINEKIGFEDPNKRNLVDEVSIKEPATYNEKGKTKIVLVDCGAKFNIIRSLVKRDCCVIRVPWDYDFTGMEFDGVMLSNGPGDPTMCRATIENVKKLLGMKKTVFGICLGNQLLALAAGGRTYKLKYGHRSQNQPCTEVGTKRCYITTQNHGFAVDDKALPAGWKPWFINANDGTNEGIMHDSANFFSVQFHPEARPGPVDADFLFDKFLEKVRKNG